MEERRAEDKRIEEIHKTVEDIRSILQGEQGICVRTAVNERSITATQNELKDHKNNHWQFAGLVIAGSGVIVAIVALIIPLLRK